MAADRNPRRWHTWLGLLVILCLSYAIYSPASDNDFTYDDAVYVKIDTRFLP